MISVVLVQHNNGRMTLDAITSLRRHHADGFEVLVVDNASTDGSASLLRQEGERLRLVESPNRGFGAANNLAAADAKGDILLFLNNDTLCTGEYLSGVEKEFFAAPGMGVLGPRLNNRDGTLQLSAGRLPTFWGEIGEKLIYAAERRRARQVLTAAERFFSHRRQVGWVTGAALFIRRELFRRLGGFDQRMFMYFEDKDLCARAGTLGAQIIFDPRFAMIHLKGGSSPGGMTPPLKNEYRKSQLRYYSVHRPVYEQALLKAYLRMTGRTPDE
jgi:hypothetical protein